MTSSQVLPALVVSLVAWRVYVRVRRNIGQQPFQPRRLKGRIVFFSAISLLIGAATVPHWLSLAALAGGLLLAIPLAMMGLKLTRFDLNPAGRFYTPNTAIGIALTVLLVGRVGYRFFVLYGAMPSDGHAPPAMFQSPVTLLVFGITAGYYIAYYSGVLTRGNKLTA